MASETGTKSEQEIKGMTKPGLVSYCISLQKQHNIITENISLTASLADLNTKMLNYESFVNDSKNKSEGDVSSPDIDKRFVVKNWFNPTASIQGEIRLRSLELIHLLRMICWKIKRSRFSKHWSIHRIQLNISMPLFMDGERTILNFVNRKSAIALLKQGKQLASFDEYNKKVYLNESLCPYYRYMHGKCKELWKNGTLFQFWVFNGSVRYCLQEHEHVCKVCHLDDLEKVFGVFSK